MFITFQSSVAEKIACTDITQGNKEIAWERDTILRPFLHQKEFLRQQYVLVSAWERDLLMGGDDLLGTMRALRCKIDSV